MTTTAFGFLIGIIGAAAMLAVVVSAELMRYRVAQKKGDPHALTYLKQHLAVIACYVGAAIPLLVAITNFARVEERLASAIHPIDIVLLGCAYEISMLFAGGVIMWHYEPEAKHRQKLQRGVKLFGALTVVAFMLLVGLHFVIPSLATATSSP